jgi:hypothetical protein
MAKRIGIVVFALVFAIGFGAGGVFGIRNLSNQLDGWWQARSWQSTSATVLDTSLKVTSGEDTLYQVTARYRYLVDGASYEGNRVGFSRGSDSVGEWQRDHYDQLYAAMIQNRSIIVWFDPENPEHSVVDRNIRWNMLVFSIPFATLFPLISLGAIFVLFRTLTAKTTEPGLDPNGPVIRSDAKQSVLTLWGFATFWGLIAFPLGFLIIPELFGKSLSWLVVAIFPLVGLGLIWAAITRTVRLFRNGSASIALTPLQPRVGEAVSVRAVFDRAPRTGDYQFALICEKVDSRGEGTSRETIWEQERSAQNVGTHLACMFHPPEDLPASQPVSSVWIRWRVRLRFPGAKDEREFDISMGAAQEGVANQASMIERSASGFETSTNAASAQAIPESVATVVDEFSRLKIDYHPNNSPGGAFVGTLFGLVFGGAGGFMMFGITNRGAMPFAMGLIFLTAGIGIVIAVVYALTIRRTVEVAHSHLRVASRWLLGSRQDEVSVSQIKKLVTRIGGTGSVSDKRQVIHHVRAVLSDERELVLSGDIRDPVVVQSFLQLFRRHLALAESAVFSVANENVRRAKQAAGTLSDDPHQIRNRNRAVLVAKIVAALLMIAFAWDFLQPLLAGK